MNVREYFKKKNGEPMDEKYEDLLTVKEVLDIAQECVNEALKQAKNNESLHLVSHCPLCNSDNLHQYKLHHIHCKDCKENFDKSCD